jgi:predicted nucleic acid-binding Zn ribbon protein
MVATVARTCPICGDAFAPNRPGGQFCSSECRNEANKYTIFPSRRRMDRSIVIVPNATKGRMKKMTEEEFRVALRVSAWEAKNEAAWEAKKQ